MARRKTRQDAGETFAKHVVTDFRGLNLRAGPGMDQPVLRILKKGETVAQTGACDEGGWMPVDGGWVDSRYTKEV